MSLTGFFLELLIPGATACSAFLLVFLRFQPISTQVMEKQGWLLLTLFLMCSYVVGIILRHASIFPKPKNYYCLRIEKEWPQVAKALARHLTEQLGPNIDEGEESGLQCPEKRAKFTANESAALITYLRDYLLSEKSSGISDLYNYEWRLSRLARNCALPLAMLSGACWISAGIEACRKTDYVGLYVLGGIFAMAGILGLWHAYKKRIFWQVDILMRVGSFAFCLKRLDPTTTMKMAAGA
jgi:hypothetical protein